MCPDSNVTRWYDLAHEHRKPRQPSVHQHTKGDATGAKKERPNLRVVRISKFRTIADIPSLYAALFGNVSRTV